MFPFSMRKPAMMAAKTTNDAYDGEHIGPSEEAVAGQAAATVARLPPAWLLVSMAWRARCRSCSNESSCWRQAWAAPMLTVSEMRSPHQRKSAVRARPVRVCACDRNISALRSCANDQEFSVTPVTHLFSRAQALRHGSAAPCRASRGKRPSHASFASPAPDRCRSTERRKEGRRERNRQTPPAAGLPVRHGSGFRRSPRRFRRSEAHQWLSAG